MMEITWDEFCKIDFAGWYLCMIDRVKPNCRFVSQIDHMIGEQGGLYSVKKVYFSSDQGKTFESHKDKDEYGFNSRDTRIYKQSDDEYFAHNAYVGKYSFYRYAKPEWAHCFSLSEGQRLIDFCELNQGQFIVPHFMFLPGQKIRVECLPMSRCLFEAYETVVTVLEMTKHGGGLIYFNGENILICVRITGEGYQMKCKLGFLRFKF